MSKKKNNSWAEEFDWDKATDSLTEKLTAALRPAIDQAISQRKKMYGTTKAEIDVDAASRGMEQSSVVSSMKQREAESRDDDIAVLEADYESTLASNLYSALMSLYQTHTDKQIADRQMSLEEQRLAQEKELANAELRLKQKQLKAQQSAARAAESGNKETQNTNGEMPKANYSYSDYYTYVKMLSANGRKNLFESDEVYWVWSRQQIVNDIGVEGFYVLYNEFIDDTLKIDFPYDYESGD